MSASKGWDAIDGALRRLYGYDAPFHIGTEHPWQLGGPDPLDGLSIYPRRTPVPHCHYIGYGMSELYEKESSDFELSGWGFEFTFRAAGVPNDSPPPLWPVNLLQRLGRYVIESGNRFEPGHTMKIGAGLDPSVPDSAIRAITFVEDPELGTLDTPHGRVRFLQVVGITAAEYEAATGGRARELLTRIAPRMPVFVTDTARVSLAP
ncbi:suppressor of fused domain protein [Nocardia paucivorans]|uniref:suppressor of fused domain protein n=1 Tax=Nocardia paucivorans TaxID=114259 RepID=UPI0003047EBA|nr:suppressor of fused domain protein [Nocardia paucivorans]